MEKIGEGASDKMKKVVAGFIAGAVLMFSVQAFGDGISFTGKKVDGEVTVKVNDEVVGQAVIIEGKSFAPVREITEKLGGKVADVSGGVISLNSEKKSDLNINDPAVKITRLKEDINKQQVIVDRISGIVDELQKKVDDYISRGYDPMTKQIELNLMKDSLTRETSKLESLKSQLADLEAQQAASK